MAINDDLALSDDQRDLQQTLRDILEDKLSSQALRAQLGGNGNGNGNGDTDPGNTDPGFDRELWQQLARDLGLAALVVPEEHGGLGLGPAEAAIVHEELGRFLYPGPFLATSLATAALTASEDPAAQKQWLPRIASGECIGTFAGSDARGNWDTGPTAVRAGRADGEWQLDGARAFVPAGHVADLLLVPARTEQGPSLFLVQAGAAGLSAHAVPGLDLTRKLAAVSFAGTPAVLVGAEGGAEPVLRAVRHTLLLATAAEAAGGIDWCLRAGVEHAKDRQQFGRPIGSFQAVAHICVDILGHLETARATARYAAVATAQHDPEAALAANVAALRSGEAYRTVTEATIHLFGGTGFTWEHDAHLYYRRAWSAQQLAGGARRHREAVAELAGL
ncbi:acyl-CoA dehydrogenase family protein [Streptacidiphilus sp. PAMC 29251]